MYKYAEALAILGKNEELSIEDVNDIYNNFIAYEKDIKNSVHENRKININKYCNYLNAMKVVFNNRYKDSKMTADEYQIWKKSLKDDFPDIESKLKQKIKNSFIERIIEIIKYVIK